MTPERLPAGYAEAPPAYVCRQEERRIPGQGEWTFDVAFGVTSGLPDLLEAYKAADQTTPPGTLCAAVLYAPLVIYLHGQRVITAVSPTGPCSGPTPRAASAYKALGLTELGATKKRRQRSELSISSGCSDRYKDMLSLDTQPPSLPSPASGPKPIADGRHICFYDVTPDPEGDPIGELSSARSVSAAEQARINDELAKSVADPSCSRSQHRHFALITEGPASPATHVAVDGCAVQQDRGWWRATDRLRELVAAR